VTELNTRLTYSSDESSKKAALKSLQDIEKSQAQFTAAQLKGVKGANEYADAIRKLAKQDSGAANRAKEIRLETEAVEQQTLAFTDLYDEKRKAAAVTADKFGDTSSGLAGIRGGAEALGLGQLAAPLAVAEGFTDIAEAGKLLGAQLSTIGASAATAIPGLSGSAAGLVAVGAAALPIAAIVGAAGLAIHQYNKEASEQAKVLNSVIDANRAVRQDIAQGLTSDEAQARLDELQRSRAAEAETLSSLQGAYSQLETELQDSLGIFSGPVLVGIKAFDAREETLVTNITASNDALRTMDAEIVALQRALADSSLASADAAQSVNG